jgi:hypothetical protein
MDGSADHWQLSQPSVEGSRTASDCASSSAAVLPSMQPTAADPPAQPRPFVRPVRPALLNAASRYTLSCGHVGGSRVLEPAGLNCSDLRHRGVVELGVGEGLGHPALEAPGLRDGALQVGFGRIRRFSNRGTRVQNMFADLARSGCAAVRSESSDRAARTWKSPKDLGIATWFETPPAPADSPKMTICEALPWKAPMLRCTHCSASRWSWMQGSVAL